MIDTHSHINPRDISNVDEFIKRIDYLDYLEYVINVGLDYETSKYSIELSNRNNKFYSVIGVHPLYEGSLEQIDRLFDECDCSRVVGIGETGLDAGGDLSIQRDKFYDSIELANKRSLPLVIHSNNSNEECLKIIKSKRINNGFIFHCFQPNLIILDEIMNMGGYISLGTPITRKNAKKSLEVIKNVDINRLLIELDYPFMSQDYIEDGKNVFNRIREIRGLGYKELENILDNNTKRLFRRMNNE